ncbi:hypothetical protein [Synechococcus sp. N19]|uniref:hypothetical protein n=1 Tax=Synechococcus sp. N19 TaxID=2575512 RepID=UPI0010BEAC08|nr:hypothetical protein [Synechococcus sp. N19]
MKRFLLALLVLSSPALADLGPADIRPGIEVTPSKVSLSAWCVSKYSDCQVEVDGSSISVNRGGGVKLERIVAWKRTDRFRDYSGFIGAHHLYEYELKYLADDKGVAMAKFVFQNSRSSDKFYQFLKSMAGSKEVRCEYNFETRSVDC